MGHVGQWNQSSPLAMFGGAGDVTSRARCCDVSENSRESFTEIQTRAATAKRSREEEAQGLNMMSSHSTDQLNQHVARSPSR